MARTRREAGVFDLAAQQADLDRRIVAGTERLATALAGLLREASRREGVSPLQARLLVFLLQRPSAERRPVQAVRLLDVTAPTVSDAFASLDAKGLIRRGPTHGDPRSQTIALTVRGRTLARRLAGWADPALAAVAKLPRDPKTPVLSLLTAWIAELQRAGVVTVARMCLTCRFFARDAHPGKTARHHCRLLDTALSERRLRVDCPEHEAA